MWGAETGALPPGSSGVVISDAHPRTGAYSFYIDDVNDVLPFGIANKDELYVRFGYYPTGGNDGYGGIIRFYDGADTQLYLSRHKDTKVLRISRGIHTYETVLETSTLTLANDAYGCVEVYVKIADSGGRFVVRVNDVTYIDYTGDTKHTATAQVSQVAFAMGINDYASRITYGYIDDIVINDTSGTKNNSWPGLGGIVWCPVDGDGMVSEMTPSAGDDNYACVDAVPASDDDYVSGLASESNSDLYTIDESNLPVNGTINAIKLCYRAKVDEGSGVVVPLTFTSGGPGLGAEQALSTSYAQVSQTFEVDPADDSELTLAKVKAMQIGLMATEPS
jgi:hypothetical protein